MDECEKVCYSLQIIAVSLVVEIIMHDRVSS